MNPVIENLAATLRPTPWAYRADFINYAVSEYFARAVNEVPGLAAADALMILFSDFTPLMKTLSEDEFECLDQAVLTALFMPDSAKDADQWIGTQHSDDDTEAVVADWFESHPSLWQLWRLRQRTPRQTIN